MAWFLKHWRVVAIVLGLLLVLSALGGVCNRVRTSESYRQEANELRQQLASTTRTAEARISELEQKHRTAKSEYKKLVLATNPVTGEPLFDKDGKPIFNQDTGSATETETLRRDLEEMRKENENLSDVVSITRRELNEYKMDKSAPLGLNPWEVRLGYSAPVLAPGALDVASFWLGTGYHWDLAGLDVALLGDMGLLGMPETGRNSEGWKAVQAKLSASMRWRAAPKQ